MDVGPCVTLVIRILTLTWPLVFHIQGMWCQASFIPCAPSCWHPGSPIPYLRLSWGWLHLFPPRTFEAPVPHKHRPYQSMPSLATCSYCVSLQTVLSCAEGGHIAQMRLLFPLCPLSLLVRVNGQQVTCQECSDYNLQSGWKMCYIDTIKFW